MGRWLCGLGISCLVMLAAGCRPANARARQAADKSGGAQPSVQAANTLAAGKYLVEVGGCNDCHTPGWMQKPGTTPQSQWLTGVPVGFKGPWGTTYAKNLRLFVQRVSEAQWLATLNKPDFAKPPMPVYNLNHMSKADQRAVYEYIHSLGPAGKPMPDDLLPGQQPETPYIPFVPVTPDGARRSAKR